jgi:hypothetical protein
MAKTILTQQAEQLYARGVAAARGGQKTVAATLLRQAVKLNPQHEQAWLWLSGVLERPEDVAFCLRAVLGINPDNERARRGLEWIERQEAQATSRQDARKDAPILTPASTPTSDSWWSTWRASQSTWLWTFRALLLIPIVLMGATLGIRALVEAQPLPTFVTYHDIPIPTPLPTARPQPTARPTPTPPPAVSSDRAVLNAYFEQINRERQTLQTATEMYRTSADSGRTAVERATATKQMRDQVQHSREALAAIQPPNEVAAAHSLYLEGLAWEQEALDQVLEFYRSYDVAQANRAALRLQEARVQIATATASWDAFARQHSLGPAPAGSR